MEYPEALTPARLVRRYKRFLADVELQDGTLLTVHCANTGAMTACAEPGSRVWLLNSHNPKRKLPWSWEWVKTASGHLACINTARANQLVAEYLDSSQNRLLPGYTGQQSEPVVVDGRLDFYLSAADRPDCYVEVKSVTLPRPDLGAGVGCFPDARTERGLKHLQRLTALVAEGHRAVLLFAVLLEGVDEVRPARDIDPDYSQALEQARAAGVEVLALHARFEFGSSAQVNRLWLAEAVPVRV